MSKCSHDETKYFVINKSFFLVIYSYYIDFFTNKHENSCFTLVPEIFMSFLYFEDFFILFFFYFFI